MTITVKGTADQGGAINNVAVVTSRTVWKLAILSGFPRTKSFGSAPGPGVGTVEPGALLESDGFTSPDTPAADLSP